MEIRFKIIAAKLDNYRRKTKKTAKNFTISQNFCNFAPLFGQLEEKKIEKTSSLFELIIYILNYLFNFAFKAWESLKLTDCFDLIVMRL